jgi:DNA-binding response OmpR family regulator
MRKSSVDETATLTKLDPSFFRIMNTLVVVDNLPMLGIFRTILKEIGITNAQQGRTAKEALTLLATTPIDLVIIDDFSPVDGVTFLNVLRRGGEGTLPNAMPVIFVTAVADRERILAARDAGATEILLKPFSAVQLRTRIESALTKPREFVEAKSYVGPDRRRRRDDGTAAERRGTAADRRGGTEQAGEERRGSAADRRGENRRAEDRTTNPPGFRDRRR